MRVCVCAWTIWKDVKLLTSYLSAFCFWCCRCISICRGWMHGLAIIHQRRHCPSMVMWRRDAFVTYLLPISFALHFRKWAVANPRTPAVFQLHVKHLDVNLMSTLLPVRFSQAACLNKFGFFASLTMATTLAMAMRASHWFSGPFNDLFLSGVHNWIVFARKMHSTTKFAMTILSKCVCVRVCEKLVPGSWPPPQPPPSKSGHGFSGQSFKD